MENGLDVPKNDDDEIFKAQDEKSPCMGLFICLKNRV